MAGTCEVALPLPLRNTFTYRVPDALNGAVTAGARVVVPFRNRSMIGVVLEVNGPEIRGSGAKAPGLPRISDVAAKAATPYKQPLKDVAEILDSAPAVLPRLVELGHWVASYYLAPVGETFRAMLPPAVKLRAPRTQTIVAWNSTASGLNADANAGPAMAGAEMSAEKTSAAKAPSKADAKRALAEARVQTVLTERGPMPLAQIVKLAGVSRKVIERLVQQGKARQWEEPAVVESIFEAEFDAPSNVLNDDQERTLGEIEGWLDAAKFTVGLLYGVTGSGKTEVYLRAVAETLARGRNALILVPEIGLTLHMARLCRARFGDASVAMVRTQRLASPCCTAAWATRSARASGGACVTAKCAWWWARARRCLRRSTMWAWSLSTRSRSRATSRKKRRVTTGATWPWCAAKWKAPLCCSVRRRRRSKVFITRGLASTSCCAWTRASKTARWRRWRSWTCARIFASRTAQGPCPRGCRRPSRAASPPERRRWC